MAKLKFGKRLKNPFVKRKSSVSVTTHDGSAIDDGSSSPSRSGSSPKSIYSAGSDDNSNSLSILSSEAGSSLASDVRTHGPIDSDTCRRFKKNKKKKKNDDRGDGGGSRRGRDGRGSGRGRSRSRSGSRERGENGRGGRGSHKLRKDGSLPKIVESRSSTPSTPSSSHVDPSQYAGEHFRGGAASPSTPYSADPTQPPLTPDTLEEYEAFLPQPSPGRSSPLFGRDRSNLSVYSVAEDSVTIVSTTAPPEPLQPFDEPLSPGAQTVSTIDGKDIFERSRSIMSATRGQGQDKHSAETPRWSNTTRVSQRMKSCPDEYSFTSSLLSGSASLHQGRASPSILARIHRRNRSDAGTPSTDGMLEEAEKIITASDPAGQLQDTNEGVAEHATPVREREERQRGEGVEGLGKAEDPPKDGSPTSVVQMFDSEYPVELDPSESHVDGESIDDANFPMCQAKTSQSPLEASRQDPPPLPTTSEPPTSPRSVEAVAPSKKSKKKFDKWGDESSPSEQAPPREDAVAPPKIHRRSPSEMFSDACDKIKSSVPWDPLAYSSLEDAVAAHAAMLSDVGDSLTGGSRSSASRGSGVNGPPPVAPAFPSMTTGEASTALPADAGSVASGISRGSRSTCRDRSVRSAGGNGDGDSPRASEEFLERKRNAEKNEFKKVVFLKKTGGEGKGGAGGTTTTCLVSPEDAARVSGVEPMENIELKATTAATARLDAPGKKEGGKEGGEETTSAKAGSASADPPGLDEKTSMAAPRPPSPDIAPALPESSLSQTSLFLQDESTSAPSEQQLGPSSDIVVDVIRSFSFDQDVGGVQYSLSDDSCSYLSEIESIEDITICDETLRLLEAGRRYEAGAETDRRHPMRRSGTIMKVGSRWRKEGGRSRGGVSFGAGPSHGERTLRAAGELDAEEAALSIIAEKKLTWYDDETNWHKPFTLRTDESFDASTVTTMDNNKTGAGGMGTVRYNVVDSFLGDFIKGIGKYANCGGEEDVASYDASGQHEI